MSHDSQADSTGELGQYFGDRNLLYAIMALRVGFIQAEQLVASLHIWVDSKLEPIEKVLVRLGFLTEAHCALLTPVVNEFIQRQGGDARKGLSALSPIGNLYQQLKEIDDSGLNKSLAHLTVHNSPEGDEPTRLWQPNNERFRILNFHSQGGLGIVSVAFDGELGREVAFKEIRDEYANLQTARDRFIMEAEVTGRLEHPGIVPVYGLGHHPDGRPFYAMRFIRGNSLNSAIRQFHTTEYTSLGQRRLDFRRLVERFLDVCEAIEYAHSRGVLHRDLKPSNIMLGRYGETLVVDWGLAKSVARTNVENCSSEETLRPRIGSNVASRDGVAVGSPAFMSPEQASGQLDLLGPATDVFGLGATFYCLLTGRPPYENDGNDDELVEKAKQGHIAPPGEIATNVPARLGEICMKAMSVRIEERYRSASELREDIWRWLTDEPLSAFHAVVKHFEELHQTEPRVIPYRIRLARELSNFSKVYQSMERYEEAKSSAQRAVSLLDEIFATNQLDLSLFKELYFSRTQLSSVLRASGMMEKAKTVDQTTQNQFKQLLQSSPIDNALRKELFDLFLHQGFSLDETKKLHAAAGVDFDSALSNVSDELEKEASSRRETTSTNWNKHISSIRGYEILQLLRSDGLSSVYKAREESMDRIVALKIFHPDPLGSRESVDRFYDAARAQALLDHSGIVSIYSVGVHQNVTYVSMAYIEGSNLSTRIQLGPLNPLEAAELLSKVCEAIGYAHEKGVIHRNLKPANILLDEKYQPKVTGFDFAQRIKVDCDEPGLIVGTPQYMSPEQASGQNSKVGPPADVYALGAILYHLLTGRPPFQASSVKEIFQQILETEPIPLRKLTPVVPRDLEALCLKCLSKEPSERYATANELGVELRRVLHSEPIVARPVNWLKQLWRRLLSNFGV